MRMTSAARITRESTPTIVLDPDIELMLRVSRDEVGAYEELLEQYWSRVFGRFYRQLGDRQEAEDLAQDVFLRLYRGRKSYQPSARFSTWLYHIAQNVTRNALRKRRRKPLKSLGHPECVETNSSNRVFSSGTCAPSESLERAELACVVREAMTTLATRQRTALELQFEDHSYSEIAAELDMTPKAAKSLLYRARNQLRETLSAFIDMTEQE